MTRTESLVDVVTSIVHATAYCLPAEATNALDTAKLWLTIVALAAGAIGLLIIGIGAFIDHNRGEGHTILKKLMVWIGAAAIVAAATGIPAIFIQVPTNCVPLG